MSDAVACLFNVSVDVISRRASNNIVTNKNINDNNDNSTTPPSTVATTNTSNHRHVSTPSSIFRDCRTPTSNYIDSQVAVAASNQNHGPYVSPYVTNMKTANPSVDSTASPAVLTTSARSQTAPLRSVGFTSSTAPPSCVLVCEGCQKPHPECHERKYRDFCLQSVMDHFEDDGIRFTNEMRVYTTFIQAYTFCVKRDMLEAHHFYDKRVEIDLPMCMVNGSLSQAQAIRTSDHLRRILLGQRVFNVENHVKKIANGEAPASNSVNHGRNVPADDDE